MYFSPKVQKMSGGKGTKNVLNQRTFNVPQNKNWIGIKN